MLAVAYVFHTFTYVSFYHALLDRPDSGQALQCLHVAYMWKACRMSPLCASEVEQLQVAEYEHLHAWCCFACNLFGSRTTGECRDIYYRYYRYLVPELICSAVWNRWVVDSLCLSNKHTSCCQLCCLVCPSVITPSSRLHTLGNSSPFAPLLYIYDWRMKILKETRWDLLIYRGL